MYFPIETNDPVGRIIEQKHLEYYHSAVQHYRLSLGTRLCAGFSAGILPFIVGRSDSWAPGVAIVLSILIVIATVVDFVFKPKESWALYSKATDLLTLAKVRALGKYDQYKEQIDLLLNTESAALEQIMNLTDLVNKIESVHGKPGAPPSGS